MKSINEEKTPKMSEDSSHNSLQFSVTVFLTKSDLKSVCKFGDQIHQGVAVAITCGTDTAKPTE